jgi:thiol-disulfide isomerase/thioredoxin
MIARDLWRVWLPLFLLGTLVWVAGWQTAAAQAPLREAAQEVELAGNLGAPWVELDAMGQPVVNFYFFWTPTCPHCRTALPFAGELQDDYPWLNVRSYDLTSHPDYGQRYQSLAEMVGEQAQYVPAFLYCGQMLAGFDAAETTGVQIRQTLEACYADALASIEPAEAAEPVEAVVPAGDNIGGETGGQDEPATAQLRAAPPAEASAENAPLALAAGETSFSVPFIGMVQAQALSLPMLTVVLAGLDAFNPCAFFVLLFLLSMVIHARSRTRMAVIGGVFVFFSGALYFVFMAAWLNVFLWLGELALITLAAGLLALVFGALNVKDYFYLGQGPSLSISDQAKPALFDRMRGLIRVGSWPALIGSTILLALAANSYELLCTAGFPMVFTRVLTLHELSTPAYYTYLLAYSLIYIVPLTAIVAVFTVRFSARKLSEDEGRILKLLSGLMMVFMGLVLIFVPAWLSRVEVAVGLLAAAVLVTLVVRRSGRMQVDSKKPAIRKARTAKNAR